MNIKRIGLDRQNMSSRYMPWITVSMLSFDKTLRRDRMAAFSPNSHRAFIGIEACGSAHYWARELTRMGHTVRIILPGWLSLILKARRMMPTMPKLSARLSAAPGCASWRSERKGSRRAAGGAPRPGQTHPCPDSPGAMRYGVRWGVRCGVASGNSATA